MWILVPVYKLWYTECVLNTSMHVCVCLCLWVHLTPGGIGDHNFGPLLGHATFLVLQHKRKMLLFTWCIKFCWYWSCLYKILLHISTSEYCTVLHYTVIRDRSCVLPLAFKKAELGMEAHLEWVFVDNVLLCFFQVREEIP